jgi:hypothetical protein
LDGIFASAAIEPPVPAYDAFGLFGIYDNASYAADTGFSARYDDRRE